MTTEARPTRPAAPDPDLAAMRAMVRGHQLAVMLREAAGLGLADRVAAGPRPVAELAAEAGAHPGALLRLCRALAAFGVFALDAEGRLAHTARSAWLRSDARPTLHHAARYWTTPPATGPPGGRSGTPCAPAAAPSRRSSVSPTSTTCATAPRRPRCSTPSCATARTTATPRWPRRSTSRAPGSSWTWAGATAACSPRSWTPTRACADCSTTGSTWSPARRRCWGRRGAAGVADRCRVEAGDFFEAVPAGGDVYVLSQVLHDWDDGRAALVLRRCRAAMGAGARLAVVERVLPELGREAEAGDPSDFLADVNMMAILTGRERTASEFAALLAGAGFAPRGVLATRSPFRIVQGDAA